MMNRSDLDWTYLRRYMLTPMVTLGVAVLLLVMSLWVKERHERLYAEVSANRAAMHQDYDSMVSQRRVIDAYHRRYQQFSELGFVGRENRLDWVETLRTTTSGLRLPRVSYAIEPQLEVIPPVTSAMGGDNLQLRVSRMQLELGLLHEIDLLRFFDALQAQAPGFIKVDQCVLSFDVEQVSNHNEANISASCQAQIYSVITSDVVTERSL